jgi:hypothetical protein
MQFAHISLRGSYKIYIALLLSTIEIQLIKLVVNLSWNAASFFAPMDVGTTYHCYEERLTLTQWCGMRPRKTKLWYDSAPAKFFFKKNKNIRLKIK